MRLITNQSLQLMFPNNRIQALPRASNLKKRFFKNEDYHRDYKNFIEDMIEQGYCEKGVSPETDGTTRYLPHHGVYDHEKGKIRVVFNCYANFNGVSLNGTLLQRPDFTNSLVQGFLNLFPAVNHLWTYSVAAYHLPFE